MSDKKIIAVAGATGHQGGGVVRAILDDPDGGFAARAMTRDPDSDKARTLADAGAEVVAADLDDAGSVERAFEGAYGAFCVTFFWEHFSPEKEQAQVRTMAEAAARTGIRHAIWSTLEDTRNFMSLDDDRMPTLMERFKVPHFDAKGEANAFFTEAGVPTTFLHASFYWENFIFFGSGPARGPDGVLALTFPLGNAAMPGIASEDVGRCAYGIYKRPDLIRKTVGISGEHVTGAEMAAAFTRALGEEVRYNDVPADMFRSFDFPGAEDVGNMFQFKRDFEDAYRGLRDPAFARSLNPRLMGFNEWMEANKDKIPLG